MVVKVVVILLLVIPLAFYAQPDIFYVGNGDLCIENDLLNGSSEIEN